MDMHANAHRAEIPIVEANWYNYVSCLKTLEENTGIFNTFSILNGRDLIRYQLTTMGNSWELDLDINTYIFKY